MLAKGNRSRAKAFDELIAKQPQDFDPEADDDLGSDDSENSRNSEEDSQEEQAGRRSHYVNVDKSRLRKANAPLGPRYSGARVSRQDLQDIEDDSIDGNGDFDWDEESDQAEVDIVQNGYQSTGFDSEEDLDEESAIEEEEFASQPITNGAISEIQKAQLRDAMNDERAVATALSRAAEVDVEKGRAVQKQKQGFDSLLGARIKLQKALVGGNTILGLSHDGLEGGAIQAIQAAEDAATRLWSMLDDLRKDLSAMRNDKKRKWGSSPTTRTSEEMWKGMLDLEDTNLQYRNATMQKWSSKVGQESLSSRENMLRGNTESATIVETLRQHISDSDRLLKRARTPRSCAPLQLSRRITLDERIYDDADFYGQLLKELLEHRSSRADAEPAAIDIDFRPVKAKRNVDTKASKGRKMRYLVHEKLQNFMAPENRGNWSQRQADELFGSLFGRRMALGEDAEDVNIDPNGMTAIESADAARLMFRQT